MEGDGKHLHCSRHHAGSWGHHQRVHTVTTVTMQYYCGITVALLSSEYSYSITAVFLLYYSSINIGCCAVLTEYVVSTGSFLTGGVGNNWLDICCLKGQFTSSSLFTPSCTWTFSQFSKNQRDRIGWRWIWWIGLRRQKSFRPSEVWRLLTSPDYRCYNFFRWSNVSSFHTHFNQIIFFMWTYL